MNTSQYHYDIEFFDVRRRKWSPLTQDIAHWNRRLPVLKDYPTFTVGVEISQRGKEAGTRSRTFVFRRIQGSGRGDGPKWTTGNIWPRRQQQLQKKWPWRADCYTAKGSKEDSRTVLSRDQDVFLSFQTSGSGCSTPYGGCRGQPED